MAHWETSVKLFDADVLIVDGGVSQWPSRSLVPPATYEGIRRPCDQEGATPETPETPEIFVLLTSLKISIGTIGWREPVQLFALKSNIGTTGWREPVKWANINASLGSYIPADATFPFRIADLDSEIELEHLDATKVSDAYIEVLTGWRDQFKISDFFVELELDAVDPEVIDIQSYQVLILKEGNWVPARMNRSVYKLIANEWYEVQRLN